MKNNQIEQKGIDVESGNKLIAEFMGVRWNNEPNSSIETKYHSSWDWLMPVVEKINSGWKYDVIIFRTSCHINDELQVIVESNIGKDEKLIDCVWQAVIKFIQWHNQNKTQ